MTRTVALLRAVNVGGHRRVPMSDLRELAESLGLRDAVTYIQSGNLVFATAVSGAAATVLLAEGIERRFGFPVDVLVRSAAQWRKYLAANPFVEETAREPDRVVLLVPRSAPPAGAVAALTARATTGERLVLAGDALWAHFPEGVGSSKLTPSVIDRTLGSPTTARNFRTAAAILELLEGPTSP
jgi:uncharacterized protein (DUF1697 family)